MTDGASHPHPGRGRVLHVDSGRTFRGGQRQLLLLASAQSADLSSPEPVLLVRSARLVEYAQQQGLSVQAWRGPASPVGLWQLHRTIARLNHPLIHVHDSRSHGAVRFVATEKQQDLLVVHRRIDDAPRQRIATRWKYSKGVLICVSDAVVEVMASFGVDRRRLHLVHSALPERPPPSAETLEMRRSRTPALRLLAIGALVPHKGHRTLIESLSRTDETVKLRIVGAGPLREELTSLVSERDLCGRVVLVGDTPGLEEEIANADLLVQPSLSEGLGTAVLDAMWAALPVLASDVGGLSELVDDGVTGWLVPAGSPVALSERIEGLVLAAGQDPGFLLRHGIAGRDRAERCFAFSEMVRKTNDVYYGFQ